MLWFWLSMPLAAVFFGAWYGIPLWLVFTRPDWGPEPATGHSLPEAGPEPVPAGEFGEHPADAMVLAGMSR
jgi:hypothetical protein